MALQVPTASRGGENTQLINTRGETHPDYNSSETAIIADIVRSPLTGVSYYYGEIKPDLPYNSAEKSVWGNHKNCFLTSLDIIKDNEAPLSGKIVSVFSIPGIMVSGLALSSACLVVSIALIAMTLLNVAILIGAFVGLFTGTWDHEASSSSSTLF